MRVKYGSVCCFIVSSTELVKQKKHPQLLKLQLTEMGVSQLHIHKYNKLKEWNLILSKIPHKEFMMFFYVSYSLSFSFPPSFQRYFLLRCFAFFWFFCAFGLNF